LSPTKLTTSLALIFEPINPYLQQLSDTPSVSLSQTEVGKKTVEVNVEEVVGSSQRWTNRREEGREHANRIVVGLVIDLSRYLRVEQDRG
jgi:hypothetical protein